MRFKIKPKPELWDKKSVVKFAWYPIRVDDLIVWWEMYESTYSYSYGVHGKDWSYGYYWKLIKRKVFNKKD